MSVSAPVSGGSTAAQASGLLARARAGDGKAFEELIAPYRRELEVHCYRILGSLTDAEDAMQESLTAAWQGVRGFRGTASIRTWLYRVTTSRCLNLLRSAGRRQPKSPSLLGVEPPEPTRLGEVVWLQPYPDGRLDEIVDVAAGPAARYEQRETISLAFITALQLLAAQPRAILILRDVLDFSARETAAILQTTEHSVNSALRRARATLAKQLPKSEEASTAANTSEERDLVDRLIQAWEAADVPALVALMTEDVWLRMPPMPLEYRGPEQASRWFATAVFRKGRQFRLVRTRANRQPAVGLYLYSSLRGMAQASGLVVLSLAAGRISALTHFESGLMGRFGLPRTIPESS